MARTSFLFPSSSHCPETTHAPECRVRAQEISSVSGAHNTLRFCVRHGTHVCTYYVIQTRIVHRRHSLCGRTSREKLPAWQIEACPRAEWVLWPSRGQGRLWVSVARMW